jgi:hypothetical protein
MAANGLEQFTDTLLAEQITLQTVVELTHDDMKELGIPMGPRKAMSHLFGCCGQHAAGSAQEMVAAGDASASAAPRASAAAAILDEAELVALLEQHGICVPPPGRPAHDAVAQVLLRLHAAVRERVCSELQREVEAQVAELQDAMRAQAAVLGQQQGASQVAVEQLAQQIKAIEDEHAMEMEELLATVQAEHEARRRAVETAAGEEQRQQRQQRAESRERLRRLEAQVEAQSEQIRGLQVGTQACCCQVRVRRLTLTLVHACVLPTPLAQAQAGAAGAGGGVTAG